ncbi:uncharacterized protein [Antedon mediterranea]|uniref:uncharacterized protein isoform X2 n=1 Tax=Antedon mediterranea TaxID=105859 RepID=UPI003AF7AACA
MADANKMDYPTFVHKFGQCFDGQYQSLLKFLLFDYLDQIDSSTTPHGYLNHLEDTLDENNKPLISPTHLKMLDEIAQVTRLVKLRELLSNFPDQYLKSGTGLKPYRIPFYLAIKSTGIRNVDVALAFYRLGHQKRTIQDMWDLVAYLQEVKNELQTRDQLIKFASLLNKGAENILTSECEGRDKLVDLVPIQQGISSGPDEQPLPQDMEDGNPQKTLDVFISYRRSNGSGLASLLKEKMKDKGFTVFMDVENLGAGRFDTNLLTSIRSARNFIIVLSINALDRCMGDNDQNDWIHKEVVTAMETNCNIVPVTSPDFKWPKMEALPEDMRGITKYNAVKWSHEYQPASVDRIIQFLQRRTPKE